MESKFLQGDSPGFAGCGAGGGANGGGAGAGVGAAGAAPELLRRPALPPAEQRLDPLEDEHSLHMLYDYTTVHAWYVQHAPYLPHATRTTLTT